MPDIHELLHGAAPPPRGYDETDVLRRVGRRRLARRAVGVIAVPVALLAVYGAVLLFNQDDQRVVVTDQTDESPPPVAAIAIVGDAVWVGGDGFVSLGDGSDRIAMPGPVTGIAADDVMWAHGDRWVAAIDPASKKVLGTWEGGAIDDIQPLEGQEVAISQPDADTVEILRTAAEGLEEIWAIPVGDRPTNLVLTTAKQLWVNEDGAGTISELDVGAQYAAETCQWSGPLLAPALDGTIWTTDGGRVVSLDPAILKTGALSAAQGQRYDVDATMAVETPFGLYVGGPEGVRRYSPKTEQGEVIDAAVPSALAGSGGQLAYIVDGKVRTAMAKGDQTADPDAWRREPRQVAARYLSEELKWPDVVIDSDEPIDPRNKIVHATSTMLGGDAQVFLELVGDSWRVAALHTFDEGFEEPVGAAFGDGDDTVYSLKRWDGLAAELVVRFGSSETRRTAPVGEAPSWTEELGWVPDTEGFVQVLWRDANGVALEGWAFTFEASSGGFATN